MCGHAKALRRWIARIALTRSTLTAAARAGGGVILSGALGNLKVFDTRVGAADVETALANAVYSGADGLPSMGRSGDNDLVASSGSGASAFARESGRDHAGGGGGGIGGREVFGLRNDSTNSLVQFSAFVQQNSATEDVSRTWVVAGMESVKIVVDGAFAVAVVA